jgi:hypothetical protein
MLETLVNPPFAQNPPFNVNAKIVGLVCLILSAIGLLFALVALPVVLAFGGVAAGAGVGGIYALAVIGLIVSIGAAALTAYGGYRMWQGEADGKRLVIYGLAINFIARIVFGLGGESLAGEIINLLILGALYYVVVISRFPEEPAAQRPTSA